MRSALAVAGLVMMAAAASAASVPYPGSALRYTFTLDNSPTASAISVADADGKTNWVVYGTTAGLSFYNASCTMQGVPNNWTYSETGCFMTAATTYPVTSLVSINATGFAAIANDTVQFYNLGKMTSTLTVAGSVFDMEATSSPTSTVRYGQTPAVSGSMLFLASRNYNRTGMSQLRAFNVATGEVAWSKTLPYWSSNYPVTVGMIGGKQTVVVRSASENYMTILAFDGATGAAFNASFAYDQVSSLAWYNTYTFVAAIANNTYFVMNTQNGYLWALNFTMAPVGYSRSSTYTSSSSSLTIGVFGNVIGIGSGEAAYMADTTEVDASTSDGNARFPLYSISTTSSGLLGYAYVQQILWNANKQLFYFFHTAGIATTTLAAWKANTNTAANWFVLTTPVSASISTSSYNNSNGNVQGAWFDADMLYVTWGAGGYSTSAGAVWAFNTTQNQAVWRYGDNYDALGVPVVVNSTSTASGKMWFGIAQGANTLYGRRVLLGFSPAMVGKASVNLYTAGDYAVATYSNVSGLIIVVTPYQMTFFNATDGSINNTLSLSTTTLRPSLGIFTVMTMHCAASYYTVQCLDWTNGTTKSASGGYNLGTPAVVGPFVIGWYSNFYYADMTAASPSFTTVSISGTINFQPAGVMYMGSPIVAVPTTSSLQVFYGADFSTSVTVSGTTPTAGMTSYSYIYTYTNAVVLGDGIYVAGNISTASTSGSSNVAMLIKVPMNTPTAAKALTSTVTQTWVKSGTSAVGYQRTLFVGNQFPNTIFSVGDTFTGWDATTGKVLFAAAPPKGLAFYYSNYGNYMYAPSIDNSTGAAIIAMNNASSGGFVGFGIFSSGDGGFIHFVPVASSSAPYNVPQFVGKTFVYPSLTHVCQVAVQSAYNASLALTQMDFMNQRICTTFDGTSTVYGMGVIGNLSFGVASGGFFTVPLQFSAAWTQQNLPFASMSGSGSSAGDSGEEKSKAPIVIGIIVAVVIVAIIGFVVFKKAGSSGGSGQQQGTNYQEMGKGV